TPQIVSSRAAVATSPSASGPADHCAKGGAPARGHSAQSATDRDPTSSPVRPPRAARAELGRIAIIRCHRHGFNFLTLGAEPVASLLLQDGQNLYGAIQLRIHPSRIRRIEWHLDRWCDTAPFEALTIDNHIRDRQEQQVSIAHQERGGGQDGP